MLLNNLFFVWILSVLTCICLCFIVVYVVLCYKPFKLTSHFDLLIIIFILIHLLQTGTVNVTLLPIYVKNLSKCPIILYTKSSDKIAYANSVDPESSLIRVYTVCPSTKYFKKELHKKQNLIQKCME